MIPLIIRTRDATRFQAHNATPLCATAFSIIAIFVRVAQRRANLLITSIVRIDAARIHIISAV